MADTGIARAVDAALDSATRLLGTGDPPQLAIPGSPTAAPVFPNWQGGACRQAELVSNQLDGQRNQWHSARRSATTIINDAGHITTDSRTLMAGVRSDWDRDKTAIAPFRHTPEGQAALAAAGQQRLNDASGVIQQAVSRFDAASVRMLGVIGELPLSPKPDDPKPPPPGLRDLGPVAGTGGNLSGLGAADLGDVITLPDGTMVAVFGDSWPGKQVYDGPHYHGVAVEIKGFDPTTHKPIWGRILTGPERTGNQLFTLPADARAALSAAGMTQHDIDGLNLLPAGSFTANGKTYMMVSATTTNKQGILQPVGGSWLVEVTDHPGDPKLGWGEVPNSYRGWQPGNPIGEISQISGFTGKDGNVYIAGDSFDRSTGVSMFRADPTNPLDRSKWQPWTGQGWGTPGTTPTLLSGRDNWGELSMRQIDGKTVLSGFNARTGNVEALVANDPIQLFGGNSPMTTVMDHNGPVKQPYGGYIVPGSTLDNMMFFGSEWETGPGPTPNLAPYDVREIIGPIGRPR